MSIDLRGRSFLREIDFTPQELRYLLGLAVDLKAARRAGTEVPRLTGRNIALIFEKTSTRTRCAFEVAAFDQGAHTTVLDPSGSQIGHKESAADTARVLGRLFDGIEFRGDSQADLETLAATCRSPCLQRADGRVASHADAGRRPDHGGGQWQGLRRHRATRSWATCASTWAARCWSWVRSWAAMCASWARRAGPAGRYRRHRPGHRGRDRRAHHHHDRSG